MGRYTNLAAIIMVLVLAGFSWLHWNCQNKAYGYGSSGVIDEEHCWLWCGVRILADGVLTEAKGGSFFIKGQKHNYYLPETTIKENCVGQEVAVTGVLRKHIFDGRLVFEDLEVLALFNYPADRSAIYCTDLSNLSISSY